MLLQYIPILVLSVIALGFAAAVLILTHVISPKVKDPVKLTVYESGLPPQMEARLRYPIRFFVVAMMFILFDVEVIFIYPWAVVYQQFLAYGSFIFWEMLLFIAVLFAGYLYLYKRGAFKWE